MSKEAYYFSHDANARHDPKILAMRSDYGIQGYGVFWIIIEMLREQDEYRLPMKKYIFNAIAMQVQCKNYAKDDAETFVQDCINEYELFKTDGAFFWSNSLLGRMERKNDISDKRRAAAKARWEKVSGDAEKNANSDAPKKSSNANAMQNDANAMQTDAIKGNEMKRNERKGNEIKLLQGNSDEKEEPKKSEQTNVIKFYQENGFGAITPHVGNKVFAWVDDLNEPLVVHAMKKAIEANVLKWNYVESILKDWDKQKMKTVEQVEAVELQRKQQQAPFKGRVVKDEKTPDWLTKQKADRANGIVEKEEVTEDFLEAKRELMKKLGIQEGIEV